MKTPTERILEKFKAVRFHSEEFKKILAQTKKKRLESIKTILHEKPLLVFWVEPNGNVLDAGSAHRDSPPKGDKSVFTDSSYKGHLRGRAAFIGNVIYVVIYYSVGAETINQKQMFLLRKAYPKILEVLKKKHSELTSKIEDAIFVGEDGEVLDV